MVGRRTRVRSAHRADPTLCRGYKRKLGVRFITNRKTELERASFSGFALNADFSLVRLHGQPAKGEAEPSGMTLFRAAVGLSKFLEDVFVLICFYF